MNNSSDTAYLCGSTPNDESVTVSIKKLKAYFLCVSLGGWILVLWHFNSVHWNLWDW